MARRAENRDARAATPGRAQLRRLHRLEIRRASRRDGRLPSPSRAQNLLANAPGGRHRGASRAAHPRRPGTGGHRACDIRRVPRAFAAVRPGVRDGAGRAARAAPGLAPPRDVGDAGRGRGGRASRRRGDRPRRGQDVSGPDAVSRGGVDGGGGAQGARRDRRRRSVLPAWRGRDTPDDGDAFGDAAGGRRRLPGGGAAALRFAAEGGAGPRVRVRPAAQSHPRHVHSRDVRDYSRHNVRNRFRADEAEPFFGGDRDERARDAAADARPRRTATRPRGPRRARMLLPPLDGRRRAPASGAHDAGNPRGRPLFSGAVERGVGCDAPGRPAVADAAGGLRMAPGCRFARLPRRARRRLPPYCQGRGDGASAHAPPPGQHDARRRRRTHRRLARRHHRGRRTEARNRHPPRPRPRARNAQQPIFQARRRTLAQVPAADAAKRARRASRRTARERGRLARARLPGPRGQEPRQRRLPHGLRARRRA